MYDNDTHVIVVCELLRHVGVMSEVTDIMNRKIGGGGAVIHARHLEIV
jgi:hypothetical protein